MMERSSGLMPSSRGLFRNTRSTGEFQPDGPLGGGPSDALHLTTHLIVGVPVWSRHGLSIADWLGMVCPPSLSGADDAGDSHPQPASPQQGRGSLTSLRGDLCRYGVVRRPALS